MGAQSADPKKRNYDPKAYFNESPVHEVPLPPFFLSKYEMTQGQWKWFVGRNPSYYGPEPDGEWSPDWIRGGREASLLHPVERVTMVVPRDVQIALSVDRDADAVVRVCDVALVCSFVRLPFGRAQ